MINLVLLFTVGSLIILSVIFFSLKIYWINRFRVFADELENQYKQALAGEIGNQILYMLTCFNEKCDKDIYTFSPSEIKQCPYCKSNDILVCKKRYRLYIP